MRTKTLLLSAAAMLAAGLVSSQAQVYSQNIVGYATTSTPGNGSLLYMAACPFVIGVSNGADEVYGLNINSNNLPIGTLILKWNPTTTSQGTANTYTAYYYDPSYEGADQGGYGGFWDGPDLGFNLPTPTLPPGLGYFIQPSQNVTNTLAGTVAVNLAGSTTNTMPGNGSLLYMVGSAIPYAGDVTNVGAGLSLTNMPIGTLVLAWNTTTTAQGTANTYTTYYWDPSYEPDYGPWWDGPDLGFNLPDPTVPVGGAFFIQPSFDYQWVQTLQNN